MSRLVVKNLPRTITEDKIRSIFSKKGEVTDVQLKYSKSGKFRRFCFVGFNKDEEAQEALEFFNNSCISTSKITVEPCHSLGDAAKPRPWSGSKNREIDPVPSNKVSGKNATDTVLGQKKFQADKGTANLKNNDAHKSTKVKETLEKYKDDPLFLEFLETHAKDQKTLWGNDILQVTEQDSAGLHATKSLQPSHTQSEKSDACNPVSESSDNESVNVGNEAKKDISDLEYLKMKMVKQTKDGDEQVVTKENADSATNASSNKIKKTNKYSFVRMTGFPKQSKKKDIIDFFHPLKPKVIMMTKKYYSISAIVGFRKKKEMQSALLRDRSFLGGERVKVVLWDAETEAEKGTKKEASQPGREKWKSQEELLEKEEPIAESGRIFVRNLAYSMTEEELEKLFKAFGPLAEVNIPVDRLTRQSKGFATVTFVLPEHAVKAFSDLDGTVFHGRMLHLLPGKAKLSLEDLLNKEDLTFKQRRQLEKKVEANSSHNWNTLFLGHNAVADVIADAYGARKLDVVDATGRSSAAVRLALGETQIVTEMRNFLEKSGIRLEAFSQPSQKRSSTVILVKNLPAKTTAEEVRELFAKFGELGHVVLPPSGVTAVVEFLAASEARTAFRRVAYSRFKHVPLYLEWAPDNTFTTGNDQSDKTKGEDEEVKDIKEQEEEQEAAEEEPEPNTTLFIKNLNFSTREQSIREHFSSCGSIHSVTVATKKDPQAPGQVLSMGYGFIQFKTSAAADKALKTLQNSDLEGHTLELKRSHRTVGSQQTSTRKTALVGPQTGTKIMVRNVPFQAKEEEVAELFRTFGEIKCLRLPRKMVGSGQHRGFAFVDYHTKHDAKRAMEALSHSTHLYGRRLVLEWAAPEDTVEELRKRTAERFLNGPQQKVQRKGTFTPDDEDN